MSETFKVSGKKVELPSVQAGEWCFVVRPGGWCIAERKRPDGSIERRRLALHESKGKLTAQLGGILYHGEIIAKSRAVSGGGGESDLVAQFPGKVRKILVQAGTKVKEGEPLLMIEAMKMEFAVKAPSAGTVTRIKVSAGQQLSPGDRFVDFEEEHK